MKNIVDRADKRRHFLFPLIGLFVVMTMVLVACGDQTSSSDNTSSTTDTTFTANSSSGNTQTTQTTPTNTIPTREVTGKATTLGAGTFTGGKDVADGLYDVTTTSGQSGNFIVNGTDSYNEILGVSDGQGVPKIRVQISDGDQIQISGLNQVIFTPVKEPFVTSHKATTLYAGTFTVGQDIGAGRYVATTSAGSSGNFIVNGTDSYNEILGVSDGQGVSQLTVTLTDGDVITISGLSQVFMTPTN
jgi:hypothetical protein